VTAETSFGLSPNVGASDNYARADHTHGTPALSPVPGAGSLVTSETAFGISPNAGTSPDYSRADHTHGTPQLPPVPAPASAVTPEPSFGQAGNVGTSSDYARADHTHGIPPVPGPGGDLGGTSISTAIVNRVRQIDVNTTGAANGNVLMFVTATNSWQPRPLPPSQFVGRASTQPYTIVAAGAIEFRLPPSVTVAPQLIFSYNKLEVLGAYDPANGGFRFRFIGYVDVTLPGNRIQYIVKLTPWAPGGAGARNPFSAYFSDFVPAIGALEAGFTVTISPNAAALDTTVRLMIEVSQIG
jgi:hypothetical protein